jgi:hypothetical protein
LWIWRWWNKIFGGSAAKGAFQLKAILPSLDRPSEAGRYRQSEHSQPASQGEGAKGWKRFVFWRGWLEARKVFCVGIATFDENSL